MGLGIAEEGRVMNPDQYSTYWFIKHQVDEKLYGDEGEFAILSATSQATNQNAWIEEMKKNLQSLNILR